jgi:hypothetical protein
VNGFLFLNPDLPIAFTGSLDRWTLPRHRSDPPDAKMAKSPGAYQVIDNAPEEAESDATKDYDDVISSESTYLGNPSESFEIEEDLEDGLVTGATKRKRGWIRFWDSMSVRERRMGSLDKERWLGQRKRGRRKGGWYNCFIFGGISGLCILYACSPFSLLYLLPSLANRPTEPSS